ncbi:MAG: prepilin-type N-terminal cleavage/methylation domain-containing protein [Phycisphaerales bacterium]
MRRAGARAFTLVEMLVTIGIIALLLGILLVGLRGVLGTAGRTKELSNLRQVYYGWQMYSGSNDEYILPGYLDDNTQQLWAVDYKDVKGQKVPPASARGWAWRLAPYVDYSWDVLCGYRTDFLEELAAVPVDIVAKEPAFGYNAYYVGGWWEAASPTGPATMKFDDLPAPFNTGMIARTQGSVARPETQILFCSSSQRDTGTYKNNDNRAATGSFWVVPPHLGATQVWEPFAGGGASMNVLVNGQSVPINRYNTAFAALVGDGGTVSLSMMEMTDMRRWVNAADKPNWTHP